jgi:ectoine hydroxylase-related dioxygenase (phytanoyl-CoA dioxygenase family)/cyclopropane fatty-acyl-phospholipid synthase-like methyltransferase
VDQCEAATIGIADDHIGNQSWRAVTCLNGSDFVAAAYRLVLSRAPDEEGGVYYLNRLRAGAPKLMILGELQDSVEGRACHASLPGLRRAALIQRLALTPLVGDWLARLFGAERMTKRHRRARAIEQQLLATALALQAPARHDASKAGTTTSAAEPTGNDHACPTPRTPRQIFHNIQLQPGFMKAGYARVPMLLPGEVTALLARLATLKPDDNFAPTGRGEFQHRYHCSFLDTNPRYKREAHRLIREFFDPHVTRYLNGYRILTSNFYVKPPGTGEFQIHQNWPAIRDLNDTTVTIWCPLVDVTESNGAIQVVAGSHKILPHVEGPICPSYFNEFREELIAKYLKAIPMTAGEGLIFDDSLIHWSATNNSDQARIAIQILCVPSDAQPVYFFFDRQKPEEFELIAIDEDFYLATDVVELTVRQPHWKSLGFVKNRNSYPTEAEFAALLDQGDEIRSRICDGGSKDTPDAFLAVVEPPKLPARKLRELAGCGYTIQPFLNAYDLEALAALYGRTTPVVPSEFHVSAFMGDPDIRRRIYEGIAAVVSDKLEALAPGYRLVMASFVTKKANSTRGRLGLHQDYSLVDHATHLGLNVWIPLVDVDARNACLRVVEGSQIFGHISANPPNPAPYWNVRQVLDSGVYLKDVPMARGHAFLFDTRLLHATEENQTDSDRIAVFLNLAPVNVPVRLYQWHERDPDRLEVWEIDREFYLRMAPNTYIDKPDLLGAKFAGHIEYKFEKLTPSDLQGILPVRGTAPTPHRDAGAIEAIRDAREPVQSHDTADVRNYYDEKTAAYLAGFGEVFQGSRPESTDDLLQYIVDAAKIADGMKILDAGCGVCGPAAWLAEHLDVTIEALTISPVQVREAQTRVNARGLGERISVREGDFHKLAELYPAETFDRVLFLETVCHARDYRQVIGQAKRVLKPGGYLYIKDFYCQDYRSRPELLATQREDLKKLNSVYRLVVPDIASTVDLIQELGFRLKYVREPSYDAVFGPWLKYEQVAGVGWNPKLSYLDLISGLEIFCRKPEAPAERPKMVLE